MLYAPSGMDTPHATMDLLRSPVPGTARAAIDLVAEGPALLTRLFDAVPVGLALFDRELRYVTLNQYLADMHGLPLAVYAGARLRELLPELGMAVEPYLAATLATGRPSLDVDISVATPATNGHEGHWMMSFHPYPDTGLPLGVFLTMRDTSETRRARLALADSELRARRTLDNLVSFVGTLTPDGTLIDANHKALDAVGILLSDVLGMKFWDCPWWTHDPVAQSRLRLAVANAAAGRIERYDVVVRTAGDGRMALDFMLAPLRDASGNITHLISSAIDITARKTGQALLEGALAEKTALLNELHHRVKNNLQVISSLLNLQRRHAAPAARPPLEESLGRVQAMAVLHELLYASKSYAAINLADYLRQLTTLLRAIAGSGQVAIRIDFTDRGGGLQLDLQRAVPCGLLVNELVTNAVKHAFPNRAGGRVDITLDRLADGRGAVIVEDDGIGLPPEEELATGRSLGFQLVPLLAEQLRAELQTQRTPHTRFEIRFPAAPPGSA